MHGTVLDPGSAISTWTVEIVGHVVGRFQSCLKHVKTTCERRERKSCRKALVKLDESTIFMTIEKHKYQHHVNKIMLVLVDRSDVVVRMTVRVVKAPIVCRVQKEQ